MPHQLFIEIEKFNSWAESEFSTPQTTLGGEWETLYKHWDGVYTAFEHFIITADINKLTEDEIKKLLYIIARDNEMEGLAEILAGNESALVALTERSVASGHSEDKWQLAIQLHKLTNKALAAELLEKLVNDDDEYVSRRALMEMAVINAPRVEFYCEKLWHKNRYGDMEEYQRMAVLQSLKVINSPLLNQYLALAKEDGRQYLVQHALEIERGDSAL